MIELSAVGWWCLEKISARGGGQGGQGGRLGGLLGILVGEIQRNLSADNLLPAFFRFAEQFVLPSPVSAREQAHH